MAEPQQFTVQTKSGADADQPFTGCIHVQALSPVDAAERVLHERLSLCGQPGQLAAKVWRLGEDYQPVSVLLYRPQP